LSKEITHGNSLVRRFVADFPPAAHKYAYKEFSSALRDKMEGEGWEK